MTDPDITGTIQEKSGFVRLRPAGSSGGPLLFGGRMIQVGLKTNAGSVALEFSTSARDMRDKATSAALNEMAEQVKVAAARGIRDAGYKVRVRTIKQGLSISRAAPSKLRAAVIARGRPIPLVEFSARQTSRGVSVSVLHGRKTIAGAFIAVMPNGHRGVFVRGEGARHKKMTTRGKPSWHALEIRELFGPSVPDGMANTQVQEALQAFVAEKFPVLLARHHKWLASRGRR